MHKDDIDDVLRRKVAPSVNSDVAYDVGDVWELLENIFCVKNDGNDIRGGSGSVGRMGRRGGGEPGVALDGIGRTMEAENGLKNTAYTVAMARTPDPHSASAQFFINVADNDFLNFRAPTPQEFGYCVFGKVVEGQDVVDKIRKVATGSRGFHRDVPVEDVVIKSAEVVE